MEVVKREPSNAGVPEFLVEYELPGGHLLVLSPRYRMSPYTPPEVSEWIVTSDGATGRLHTFEDR